MKPTHLIAISGLSLLLGGCTENYSALSLLPKNLPKVTLTPDMIAAAEQRIRVDMGHFAETKLMDKGIVYPDGTVLACGQARDLVDDGVFGKWAGWTGFVINLGPYRNLFGGISYDAHEEQFAHGAGLFMDSSENLFEAQYQDCFNWKPK